MLLDMTGKVVYQHQLDADTQKHQVNIRDLPQGIYVGRLMVGDQVIDNTKILIQ